MKYKWKRHLIILKHYKQHTYESCGPACLRMILERYGRDVSEQKLRKLSHCSKDGTDEWGLKKAAEKLGFESITHYNLTFSRLIKKLEKNIPLLVAFREHWQIVIGYDASHILIADPAVDRPFRKIRNKRFKYFWGEFNNWAMEFKPRSKQWLRKHT
ncbi:MAG: cysteine peptidase family C39 domain-containing protein [Candidatus Hodarchaeota archaeon]